MYSDTSQERLALMVQQQLRAVGVEMELQLVSSTDSFARAENGNFDAWLIDIGLAPTMFRQYLFWHSRSSLNWGRYQSEHTDAAFAQIQAAQTDKDYKAGVAAFARAIADNPPAVFLTWIERARSVSTRFQVPDEPGRDILRTMRLWRPIGAPNPTVN
jgi:ABC-type transport system substrate-binding protein